MFSSYCVADIASVLPFAITVIAISILPYQIPIAISSSTGNKLTGSISTGSTSIGEQLHSEQVMFLGIEIKYSYIFGVIIFCLLSSTMIMVASIILKILHPVGNPYTYMLLLNNKVLIIRFIYTIFMFATLFSLAFLLYCITIFAHKLWKQILHQQ